MVIEVCALTPLSTKIMPEFFWRPPCTCVYFILLQSGKADSSSTYEVKNGVIRVNEYEQTLAMQPSTSGLGTKGLTTYKLYSL